MRMDDYTANYLDIDGEGWRIPGQCLLMIEPLTVNVGVDGEKLNASSGSSSSSSSSKVGKVERLQNLRNNIDNESNGVGQVGGEQGQQGITYQRETNFEEVPVRVHIGVNIVEVSGNPRLKDFWS
jgi:hypothetical protein